jgi:Lar family restriction alleviation protein
MADQTQSVALKPCPFCGQKPPYVSMEEVFVRWDENEKSRWQVVCGQCATHSAVCRSEAEALAHWNTRVEPKDLQVEREWTAALSADSKHQIQQLDAIATALGISQRTDNTDLTAHVRALREQLDIRRDPAHPSWQTVAREDLLDQIRWGGALLRATKELADHYRNALDPIRLAAAISDELDSGEWGDIDPILFRMVATGAIGEDFDEEAHALADVLEAACKKLRDGG